MIATFDNEMAFFIKKKNRHGVVSMTGHKIDMEIMHSWTWVVWELVTVFIGYFSLKKELQCENTLCHLEIWEYLPFLSAMKKREKWNEIIYYVKELFKQAFH